MNMIRFLTVIVTCGVLFTAQDAMCASETDSAMTTDSEAGILKSVRNLFFVSQAARAAGYSGKWSSVEELIKHMESGVNVKVGDDTVVFKVEPLSESERKAALQHISIANSEGALPKWVP